MAKSVFTLAGGQAQYLGFGISSEYVLNPRPEFDSGLVPSAPANQRRWLHKIRIVPITSVSEDSGLYLFVAGGTTGTQPFDLSDQFETEGGIRLTIGDYTLEKTQADTTDRAAPYRYILTQIEEAELFAALGVADGGIAQLPGATLEVRDGPFIDVNPIARDVALPEITGTRFPPAEPAAIGRTVDLPEVNGRVDRRGIVTSSSNREVSLSAVTGTRRYVGSIATEQTFVGTVDDEHSDFLQTTIRFSPAIPFNEKFLSVLTPNGVIEAFVGTNLFVIFFNNDSRQILLGSNFSHPGFRLSATNQDGDVLVSDYEVSYRLDIGGIVSPTALRYPSAFRANQQFVSAIAQAINAGDTVTVSLTITAPPPTYIEREVALPEVSGRKFLEGELAPIVREVTLPEAVGRSHYQANLDPIDREVSLPIIHGELGYQGVLHAIRRSIEIPEAAGHRKRERGGDPINREVTFAEAAGRKFTEGGLVSIDRSIDLPEVLNSLRHRLGRLEDITRFVQPLNVVGNRTRTRGAGDINRRVRLRNALGTRKPPAQLDPIIRGITLLGALGFRTRGAVVTAIAREVVLPRVTGTRLRDGSAGPINREVVLAEVVGQAIKTRGAGPISRTVELLPIQGRQFNVGEARRILRTTRLSNVTGFKSSQLSGFASFEGIYGTVVENDGMVKLFSQTGQAHLTFNLDVANSSPIDMEFNPAGGYWVLNQGTPRRIFHYNAGGGYEEETSFDLDAAITAPTGITYLDNRIWIHSARTLYAYDTFGMRESARDFVADPAATNIKTLGHDNDDILALDSTAQRVFAFTPAGDRHQIRDIDFSGDDHGEIVGVGYNGASYGLLDKGRSRVAGYDVGGFAPISEDDVDWDSVVRLTFSGRDGEGVHRGRMFESPDFDVANLVIAIRRNIPNDDDSADPEWDQVAFQQTGPVLRDIDDDTYSFPVRKTVTSDLFDAGDPSAIDPPLVGEYEVLLLLPALPALERFPSSRNTGWFWRWISAPLASQLEMLEERFSVRFAWPAAAIEQANIATPGRNRLGDVVTLYRGEFSSTRSWDGISWIPVDQFVDGNLLVSGTVTANALVSNSVTTEKINVGAVTGDKIASVTITGDKITLGAITNDLIAEATLTADRLVLKTLTGDYIAETTIASTHIQSNAVLANHIKAGQIVAGKLAADAVITENLVAGVVIASKIATNAVTAVKIRAGAVETDKLKANSVTASKMLLGHGLIAAVGDGLTIQAASNSAITVGGNGIALQVAKDSGVTVTRDGVGIVAGPSSGLAVTKDGIGIVAADNTISLSADGIKVETANLPEQTITLTSGDGSVTISNYDVSLNVGENSGLTVTSTGVAINTHGNSLSVGENGIALQVAQNSGLAIGSTGLALVSGDNALSVGATGITFNIADATQLEVTEDGVKIKSLSVGDLTSGTWEEFDDDGNALRRFHLGTGFSVGGTIPVIGYFDCAEDGCWALGVVQRSEAHGALAVGAENEYTCAWFTHGENRGGGRKARDTYIEAGNNFHIWSAVSGQTGFDANFYVDVSGNVKAVGTITGSQLWATSDLRLKDDLEPITGALEKVESLTGYTYTMKGQERAGLIAQEVANVLPEAVGEAGDFLTLSPSGVIGLLVEAIKEQSQEIKELREMVSALADER